MDRPVSSSDPSGRLERGEEGSIGNGSTVSNQTRIVGGWMCGTRANHDSAMPLAALLERVSNLGNGFFVALWIVAVTLLVWQRRRKSGGEGGGMERDAKGDTKAPEPVHCGDITLDELRVFDGRDPKKPLYVAVRGKVYDVTRGMAFYGPGCAYSCFTGR
eukprot:scaffold5_cov331-Pavlova_lutheri.AAC.60